MSCDFAAEAKRARAQLSIPDVPLQQILMQSAQARKQNKLRTLVLSAAISLATVGTAAAFGNTIYSGVRLWLSGNNTAVTIQSFAITHEPTAADLKAVIGRASFPVILPAGLPKGTHLRSLKYAPAERPDVIFVDYRNDRTKFHTGFALFAPDAVKNAATLPAASTLRASGGIYSWKTGQETVVVLKRAISRNGAAAVQAAMAHASPQSSLAQTQPMLSRALILGLAKSLPDIAQRYAHQSGQTAVLGPRLVQSIHKLAAAGRPLRDPRTAYLTKIPFKHGLPDYAKATVQWPFVVAVPLSGVRAIDAVLARSGRPCSQCAVVLNRQNALNFSVWVVAPNAPYPEKRYSVNVKTLVVTQQ